VNSIGCARFKQHSVLLDSELPVYIKKGDTVPYDGIFMQEGFYVRMFEKCAEAIPNKR